MKFLVSLYLQDSYYSLPQEKRVEFQAGMLAFTDRYLKSGKLKEVYFTTDMRGGYAIWDIASSDELARATIEYPLSPFTDFETVPLVEYDVVAKMMKAMAKSKKIP
jgi:muconolactone delta-isomerase